MASPFAFVPYALAAHGGRIDEFPVDQLIAAGLTLLQRSATLVRALSAKRSAILLPTSPQFLVALGASEGRGAVLIDPLASRAEIAYQLADANVGAVFTNAALAAQLPSDIPYVLLDEAPRSALVVVAGQQKTADLGSHHGLALEGESDVPGSDEEAAIVYTRGTPGPPHRLILSHGDVLASARATTIAAGNTANDRVLALLPFAHLSGLTVSASAPLIAGAHVSTMPLFNPARAAELIASGGITEVVGEPGAFGALLSAIQLNGASPTATRGALRLCVCDGSQVAIDLQQRWLDATGVELRAGRDVMQAF